MPAQEGWSCQSKLEDLLYEKGLRELSILSLVKRWLWGDLVAAFLYLKGAL